MGLFSKPKCPYCGSELQETNYAAPFSPYRCRNCIRANGLKKRIEKLEAAQQGRAQGRGDSPADEEFDQIVEDTVYGDGA